MQAPAELLAGKYKFKSSLQAGSKALAWLAEAADGTQVIVSALAGARVAALKKSVDVRHPHLATLLGIVEDPPADQVPGGRKVAAVVVAEHFAGETLHQRLKRGPLEPALGVDWFIRIGGAVAAIHAAGGAHGAISPRSIIVGPEGNSPGPRLTQLVAPSSGAYCAPERLQGLGPSEADDVWALHSALFTSLACTPPFRGENKNELLLSIAGGRMKRLDALGVNDAALSDAIEKGLSADLKRRRANAAEFLEALEAWSPPQNADWEDDEATLVASGRDFAALTEAVGTGDKPVPVASVPPVSLDDDQAGVSSAPPAPEQVPEPPQAPPPPQVAAAAAAAAPLDAPGAEPGGYEDDDDATAIMSKPPSDVAALLAGSAPPSPVPTPPITAPIAQTADEVATMPENTQPSDPFASVAAPAQLPGFGAPMAAPAPPMAESAGPPEQAATPPPPAVSNSPGTSAFPPSISAYPPAMEVAPVAPELNLDDEEIQFRKAGRGPIIVIVAILVLVAVVIGVAMFLNNRASRAGNLRSGATTPPQRTPSSAPLATKTTSPVASSVPINSVSAKPEPPKPPVDRGTCVAAHFEPGTLSGKEDFDFLCKDKDFRGVNSQLHRRLVVAGVGKVTPGMREWSTLGWFELAATGLIRKACCPPGTAAARLPETAEGCAQLSDVMQKITRLPIATSETEARAKTFQDAIVCLFAKGIPRPYKYSTRPTGHSRTQFQTFLTRAAARS